MLIAAASEGGHWAWSALGLLSVPALVALNAFFVAAEFALVAVRKTRVEEMVNQGVAGSRSVLSAVNHLDRSIAATQLGITLASIALGWVGEPALARLIDPLMAYAPDAWRSVATHSAATALAFALITFMHVVFGELIPKTVALQVPDKTAIWVARPLNVFSKLSRPLIVVMNGTGNRVLHWCGFRAAQEAHMVHSVEELVMLVEDTEEAGLIDEDQAEFLQNVFRLSNKQVCDCMVPREKMATLELHTPPDKVLEHVRQGAHTRLPVFDGEMDNIVGIVNTKDLFYLFSLNGVVILEDAIYPATYLKPDEFVGTALRLLKQARRPMALVRDDAGKIVGLITLEDVIEEIVGDIEDEHDRPTPKLTRRLRSATVKQAIAGERKKP
ncbi:MAG: HlyC/CorC family transporter [Planctomycetia bacterium]|nr:HlyC/CorC family transporter [Planctomycetia bacterium]